MTEAQWMRKQLAPLVGTTVVGFKVEEVKDEYTDLLIPIIVFNRDDGTAFTLEIVGDAEGNFSAHIETHKIS